MSLGSVQTKTGCQRSCAARKDARARGLRRAGCGLLSLLVLALCGCPKHPVKLKYKATGQAPELLAVYEGWFGHPRHISVGYSSHDPTVVQQQIEKAKSMGISGFVMDWYGDREPFIDQSYALLQKTAAENHFTVAMMYDETSREVGATDETIADLNHFRKTYLAPGAPGSQAYLRYEGRPVIFVFPHGRATNWEQVRRAINKWNPRPFLLQESLPKEDEKAFDGDYAWVNPGPHGWVASGQDWGRGYLERFYETMGQDYPNKMIVGGAWSQFNDQRASWSLNRHMSARCGQTFSQTFEMWHNFFPRDQVIPFMLIETWNDYEEGTAIEPGIPTCGPKPWMGSLRQAAQQLSHK